MENKMEQYYRTPSGYFDELEQNVLSKTVNQPRRIARLISITRPYVKYAAAILALFCVGIFLFQSNNAPVKYQNQVALVDIEEELFEAFLGDEIAEQETLSELADFMNEITVYNE